MNDIPARGNLPEVMDPLSPPTPALFRWFVMRINQEVEALQVSPLPLRPEDTTERVWNFGVGFSEIRVATVIAATPDEALTRAAALIARIRSGEWM